MTNRSALIALREKVEAGEAVGQDFCIGPSIGWFGEYETLAHRSYHGSIDAAVALLEEVLPGWAYVLTKEGADLWRKEDYGDPFCAPHSAEGPPARALLLATLDALIEETEDE